jgi:hypothetical protein
MAQNIKLIKLLNGQDIMAEVISQNDKTIRIKNAVAIVVVPSRADPKTPSVGLAPWAEFSDDKEIDVASFHIMCIMNPIKEFISQYNAVFGGIVMPQNKLIIPGA